MGTSKERETGKAKLARLKAEQKRERQRRILVAVTAAVVVVVLVVVGAFYLVSRQQRQDALKTQQAAAKSNGFIQTVRNVPAAAFDTAGDKAATTVPTKLPDAPALTKDGKPRMIFYGAEFCPYCAMERWAIVASLSRFGTFTGLTGSVSSEDNIPTMDFLKSRYTSQYLSFTSYETQGQTAGQPLQKPTPADQALFTKYDTPTYFPSMGAQGGGSIPFIMYDGTYATSGSTYNQAQAMQGMTTAAVAATLKNPTSPIGGSILSAANVISAQVCAMTANKPANVCSSSGVVAASAKLKK